MQTFIRYNHTTAILTESTLASALQAIKEQKIIALETKLRRTRNPFNKMKIQQDIRTIKQSL